jgi:general secretion pathway protein K
MNAQRQRGVAIIMAILIVALATSVAAYAAWQQNLWLRQTENLVTQAQALAVARAGINFGRAVLAEDGKEDAKTGNGDHFQENWAKYSLAVPVEGGTVSGKIQDQQGLFNVNNLAATDPGAKKFHTEAFQRLLAQLDLPGALADAVEAWIDSGKKGSTDLTYLAKQPPYRAANQPLLDFEELSRVQGFDEKTLEKLRPFVTALPVGSQQQQQQDGQTALIVTPTPVNVNTAPKEILEALFESGNGERVLKLREQKPFKNDADFRQRAKDILGEGQGQGDGAEQGQQPPEEKDGDQNGDQPPAGEENGRRRGKQAGQAQQPAPTGNAQPIQPANPGDPQQRKYQIKWGEQGDIDAHSYYFLVVANTSFGRAQISLGALVHRQAGGAPPTILWQKQLSN